MLGRDFYKVFNPPWRLIVLLVFVLLLNQGVVLGIIDKEVVFNGPWFYSDVTLKFSGSLLTTNPENNEVVTSDSITSNLSFTSNFDGEWYFNGGYVSSPRVIFNSKLMNAIIHAYDGDKSLFEQNNKLIVSYVCCDEVPSESTKIHCSLIKDNINSCSRNKRFVRVTLNKDFIEGLKNACHSECSDKVGIELSACLSSCFERKRINNVYSTYEFLLNELFFEGEEDDVFGNNKISFVDVKTQTETNKFNVVCGFIDGDQDNTGLWCSALTFAVYSSGMLVSKPELILSIEELKEEFGVESISDRALSIIMNSIGSEQNNQDEAIKEDEVINEVTDELTSDMNIELLTSMDEFSFLRQNTKLLLLNKRIIFDGDDLLLSFDLKNIGSKDVLIKDITITTEDGSEISFKDLTRMIHNSVKVNDEEKVILGINGGDICNIINKRLIITIYYKPVNFVSEASSRLETRFFVNKDLFITNKRVSYEYFDKDFFIYYGEPTRIKDKRIDLHVSEDSKTILYIKNFKTKVNNNLESVVLELDVMRAPDEEVSVDINGITQDFNPKKINWYLLPKTEFIKSLVINGVGHYNIDITNSISSIMSNDEGLFGFIIESEEPESREVVIKATESTNEPKIKIVERTDKNRNIIKELCSS